MLLANALRLATETIVRLVPPDPYHNKMIIYQFIELEDKNANISCWVGVFLPNVAAECIKFRFYIQNIKNFSAS